MSNIRRIQKDLKDFKENPLTYCTGGPVGDNLCKWQIIIDGPQHSPYEGGKFKIAVDLSEYPLKAPIVVFETKIFHPNVDNEGVVCLEILKKEWSPILTIQKVIIQIYSLLNDPNPDSPLNAEAARLLKDSQVEFVETVRKNVRLYASK
ncbi:Ubiquitin-conjugating_enzyme E2 [Hexamita inflata]|uniref:Ubiquitin-conjugating_enzyme E2 n=1 Tax=Hexamita inflata TaxID=28002 RepID=A0ABP1I0X4_9EUKA